MGPKLGPKLRVRECVSDGRLQVPEFAAAIEALAAEAMRVHGLLAQQPRDTVGELDLSAHAARKVGDLAENPRRQDVASGHTQA